MTKTYLLTVVLTALVALGTFAPIPATAQDVVWERFSEPIDDFEAYARERRQARAELEAKNGVTAVPTPRYQVAQGRVFLPSYEVDTNSAAGLTTLFAVRNLSADAESVQIQYFDRTFVNLKFQEIVMDPEQILPINLRDIPEVTAAAEPDGIARGSVIVTSVDVEAVLTGDYFIVDPGQNFATGGNMADDDPCRNWSVRFLNGGAFTGGTLYRTLINSPRGTDPEDDHTVIVTVRDETGAALATVGAKTADEVFNFTAEQVLLGAGLGTTSGSLEIFLDDLTELGGLVSAEFSATGRFSVGVDAICEDVPPEL